MEKNSPLGISASFAHLALSITILLAAIVGLIQIWFLKKKGKFGKDAGPILWLAMVFAVVCSFQLLAAAFGKNR
jgi:hypothetical protein